MVTYLFLDLDETILDFHKAERIAVSRVLAEFGLEPTDEVVSRYSAINQAHWEALERRELTLKQVKTQRFSRTFEEYGKTVDADACAKRYESALAQGHYFLPGAKEALERLSEKYRLYLVSNGDYVVQESRLKSADIGHLFQDIFISEKIGAHKPSPVFFDTCFSRIAGFRREEAMIVGDSLSSDILGGKNAGIATCWVNPTGKAPREDIVPDYTIRSLPELPALLSKIG